MRTTTSLFVVILLLQAVAVVDAAEMKVTGTITEIDIDNRSITVQPANFDSGDECEPITLDVIRRTKFTVQGEWARLSNILLGQSANVTYDDELAVATLIAVRESLVRDEEKTVANLKALQGNWICVAEEEASAGVIDPHTVRERNRRVAIFHNNLTMRRTLDGKRGIFTGTFRIDPVMGHFDFIGTHANGTMTKWIGVYEIKDDTWRLRYNEETPTESVRPAGLDEREKSKSRMYTLKRDVH
ncbi:MAG: hypothetical protein JWP89_4531 [Schlesneria sp.]|nr:hypothetical protein [Schlesneria sp.]